jgi:2-polyprenyl-3-methyl-5-hydroxy-6-metoxy-1,4-benzoquinol methylase
MDPALHYLLHGGYEGRNPSGQFDTAFYLAQYPDVRVSGMNPLLHYVVHGAAEQRLPVPPPAAEEVTDPVAEAIQQPWVVYPVQLMAEEPSMRPVKVRYFDESIKNNDYGNAIAHWDASTQAFWRHYVDRYYEFFVLSKKIKQGHILDVGAEFYNKHIKEVIAAGQHLTVVDIKEPEHPDILIVQDLDQYFKFDMTYSDYRDFTELTGKFDTVLSFGVLSYYDFTPDQCARYLDNMVGFMKPEGMAVIKVDQHALQQHAHFPAFPVLHQMITDRFAIDELDILITEGQEFCIYYGHSKQEQLQV